MRISGYWLRRQIAICLVMFLAVPLGEAAVGKPQQAVAGLQDEGVSSVRTQSQNSNGSISNPAADTNQSEASPDDPHTVNPQTSDHSQPSGASQSTPEQLEKGASNPVGTAAAPYEKTTGVAASRPAGAAIAPAKQRRARSILIKVGVLLGAAVAIGTVAALSKASPSRPN